MYSMGSGGVEKSLCELLKTIDYTKYEVDLYLLHKDGVNLEYVDPRVTIKEYEIPNYIREFFLHSTKQSLISCLKNFKFKIFFNLLFNKVKYLKKPKLYIQSILKKINDCNLGYDISIDYQGMNSFTTLYCAHKIKAERKYTWNHNDILYHIDSFADADDTYNMFDGVFSVSKSGEKNFLKRFPDLKDRSHVFYNIINKDLILEQSKLESPIGSTDCFKILSIGRLSYEKGFDIALEAMKRLKQDGLYFKYYIIGDGSFRNELESYVKNNEMTDYIEFVGYKQNPYVYLKDCDLYLQPSRQEGFCISLTEAKLFGKIILTTDFAGAREQIINNKTGLIINADEKEIYKSIRRLFDNENIRNQIKSNLIESNFICSNEKDINYILEM